MVFPFKKRVAGEDCSFVQSATPTQLAEAMAARSRPFPEILMEILSNPEFSSIVSWLPHGRSFAVHDQDEFESKVLPHYFRRVIFRSFARKLNRWGFRTIKKKISGYESTFQHELFVRDHPELCAEMRCNSNPSMKADAAVSASRGSSGPAVVDRPPPVCVPAIPPPSSSSSGGEEKLPLDLRTAARSAPPPPHASFADGGVHQSDEGQPMLRLQGARRQADEEPPVQQLSAASRQPPPAPPPRTSLDEVLLLRELQQPFSLLTAAHMAEHLMLRSQEARQQADEEPPIHPRGAVARQPSQALPPEASLDDEPLIQPLGAVASQAPPAQPPQASLDELLLLRELQRRQAQRQTQRLEGEFSVRFQAELLQLREAQRRQRQREALVQMVHRMPSAEVDLLSRYVAGTQRHPTSHLQDLSHLEGLAGDGYPFAYASGL